MKTTWKGNWGIIFVNKPNETTWTTKLCHYKFLSAYNDEGCIYEWRRITDEQYQAILKGEVTIESIWEIRKSIFNPLDKTV